MPPNEKLALEVWPKAGLVAAALALPNKLVDALEAVEVVVLPKAGGAVVGAELGAIDGTLLVAFPNPPKAGADAEVVVAMDPKEGVVEVMDEPKAGTVELVPAGAPNAGGAADDVPNANDEFDPVPKAGAAEDVFTDAAGVVAELASGLAAPPNENGLLVDVEDVVTGFATPAPKPNPPAEGAELTAVVVVVANVPKAGGAVVGAAALEVATLVGGLNALKPLPPKVIGLACVTAVVVLG